MELFGIAVTILAVVLTYQAWKNGRWMKQAHQDTQELIREMHKDMAEAFRKMDETQKEIAHLIVTEGEKTRQVIKA